MSEFLLGIATGLMIAVAMASLGLFAYNVAKLIQERKEEKQ